MFSREGKREQRVEDDDEVDVVSVVEPDFSANHLNAPEDEPSLTYSELEEAGVSQSQVHSIENDVTNLLRSLSSWTVDNTDIIVAETAGVPSLAPEMLGVFLLCFLASIFVLSPKTNKTVQQTDDDNDNKEGLEISFPVHKAFVRHNSIEVALQYDHDNDSHSTITLGSTNRAGPDPLPPSLIKRVLRALFFVVVLPLRLIRVILVLTWRIVTSKKTLLLLVYISGWLFLSRVSQYKSSVIQR